jgi:hypothetical protein
MSGEANLNIVEGDGIRSGSRYRQSADIAERILVGSFRSLGRIRGASIEVRV